MLMRRLGAALSGLVMLASAAAAAEKPPVAVIASFVDPGVSEQALFSADGKILALPDLGLLWDTAAGLPLRRLNDPVFVTASAFTPDGAVYITGHKDGAIKLWSVASGAVTATLNKPGDDTTRITSLSTDGKGQFLVSGDHVGTVKVWSLSSHRLVRTVEVSPIKKGDGNPDIAAAKLSADGRRLIVLANATWTGPGIVAEYDVHSGAERSWFALPKLHAFPAAGYLDDDKALVQSTAGCARGETKLWNFADHAFIADIHKPERCDKLKDTYDPDVVKIFASGSSPRVVIAQADAPELLVWDLAARKLEQTIRWPDQVKPPNVIGLSHDLKSVAVAEPGVVRIRALGTGAPVKDLEGFGTAARNVMAHGPGPQVLLQHHIPEGDKPAIDLDLRADGLKPLTLHLPQDSTFAVHDFAPAPKIALAGNDKGEVLMLPLEPGQPPRHLAVAELREVWRAWLSPDGKLAGLVAQFGKDTDSNAAGALIDTADGKILQSFESHEDNDDVRAYAFTPDGTKLAVGRRNGKAEIWDTRTLKQLKVLPPAQEDGDVAALAFSADGRILAGSGAFSGTVYVWNVETGKARDFDLGGAVASYRYATAVAMSRDGKTVVAGLGQRHRSSGDTGSERGNVLVWDAATKKLRFTLRGQLNAIYALAFSADDRLIVAGSLDGTIRYWDRGSGKLMATAMSSASGEWLVLTESGFYAGSDGSDKHLAVVRGSSATPVLRVREQLQKPALVENLLNGDGARYRDSARKLDLSALLKSAAP
jgi:WD40 repeat protein